MVTSPDWQGIASFIEASTQQSLSIVDLQTVAGGCINSAFILNGENNHYFVKLNQAQLISMFEAEYAGLEELYQSKAIKVPYPVVSGQLEDCAFLVLEMLPLSSKTKQSDSQLGHQLADLHRKKQPFFGWHQNNTIGSTTQINDKSHHWVNFWRDNRLGFQLSLAKQNGYKGKLVQSGEKLLASLDSFFESYQPQASLLHGDLWSGNAAVTNKGEPVIYDPACYYGDRETDIAMTELFGGFGASFYQAYTESYPLHPDYSVRKQLYNLYHIINHLNLFGESYLYQAQNMIDSLLSEIS